MTGNDVTDEYDTNGNGRGRVWRITDGSGMCEYKYDKLGNVTDEIRTIALPYSNSEVYSFHMDYTYDSWGRMYKMIYPDGEKITYTYQWGGDLHSMHGSKNSNDRTYIREIQYNSFGQKKIVNYGNGTSAYYTYDALHRLANLHSTDSLGNLMQDIDYTFDNASNVTGIVNNAGIVNTLGGNYENSYHYDNLHRLTSSDGNGTAGIYDMNMVYTPSGRISRKHRNAQSELVSETVNMFYGYCDENQPHAVRRIFDDESHQLFDLRWDEAGNLGQVSIAKPGEMFETGRFLFWTKDSRMHAAVDDKHYSYYAYDYSGERRLKLTGDNKLLDVNADFMATYTTLNEPTLYPSAYMVLTNKGYTKHYYAGTERVAARLGGGGLDALYHVISNDGVLQTKADILFKQSIEQVNSRVLNENNLDCIMSNEFAKEEFDHWIDGTPYQMKADVEFNYGRFKDMVNSMLDDINHGQEKEVYFYHSDHLGSASWITDFSGVAVQHIQYLPYGEPYINQHPFGYSERFTFTGKEKDEETGYGYFGARYMDHELMTMWLSVDPMADKYPSISPYAYCAWNPIRLVDPDGREVYITGDEKSKDEALHQIQQKSKNMVFSIDKNGKLTFSGKAKSKVEKYMARIIESSDVQVNLQVQDYSNYKGETIDIGGFGGNTLSDDKKTVSTNQVINVARSAEQDKICRNPGNMIWHEISESYEGGVISLRTKTSAPAAIGDNDRTIYNEAHYNAGRYFPGSITPYEVPIPAELQGMGIQPKTKFKYTRL